MGTLALIGLGSNLGDRRAILDGAVASLASTPGVEMLRVSSYHETAPVGGPEGQGPFLNAAAALDVSISPFDLHRRLMEIEHEAGRIRVVRWGERTLDLDLLLFGDQVIGRHPKLSITSPRPSEPLQVPHPWLAFRRFVLAPASEAAPDAIDPITGRTIAGLLANLDRRPSYLALAGHAGPRARRFFRSLTESLGAAGFSGGDPSWRELAGRDATMLADPAEGSDHLHSQWAERQSAATAFLADALRADRWSEPLWGDRWIVTDFWIEQDWWLNPTDHPHIDELRETTIRPTFVAILPPWERDFMFCSRRVAGIPPEARSGLPPLFCFRPRDSSPSPNHEERNEAILKAILAACQATRSR